MLEFVRRLWRPRPAAVQADPEIDCVIGYFHPCFVFCTSAGVYVRSENQFTDLRRRVLNETEIGEYASLSIQTRMVGYSRRQVDDEDRRFRALQRRVGAALIAEIEARRTEETKAHGSPFTHDHWAAYDDRNIAIALEMALFAVKQNWEELKDIRREDSLIPAYVLTGSDGQRLVFPVIGIDRITIHPAQVSISYRDGPTAHLSFREASWETWR